jgi:hypothetical protein
MAGTPCWSTSTRRGAASAARSRRSSSSCRRGPAARPNRTPLACCMHGKLSWPQLQSACLAGAEHLPWDCCAQMYMSTQTPWWPSCLICARPPAPPARCSPAQEKHPDVSVIKVNTEDLAMKSVAEEHVKVLPTFKFFKVRTRPSTPPAGPVQRPRELSSARRAHCAGRRGVCGCGHRVQEEEGPGGRRAAARRLVGQGVSRARGAEPSAWR